MFKTLAICYCWPKMFADIEEHVCQCLTCQEFKKDCLYIAVKVSRSPLCLERWDLDFIGLLKVANTGEIYLIIACERFTRFLITEATINADNLTVAKFLYK